MEFEEYSNLRYLDPSSLQEVKVDFDYAPFGRENWPRNLSTVNVMGSRFIWDAKHGPFPQSAGLF